MPDAAPEQTERVGDVLRELLQARRLSQMKASRLLDVDHSYVARIVSGARSPSLDLIERIIERLELTHEEGMRLSLAAGLIPLGYRRQIADGMRVADQVSAVVLAPDRARIERELIDRMVASCPYELPVRRMTRDEWLTSPHDVVAWVRSYAPQRKTT